MEVKIDKSFQKDIRKIKDNAVSTKVANIILNVQQAENLRGIRHLKKLKGSSGEYSIKFSDYRIGIIITKEAVKFIRCLPRRDIYKYFPR